MYHLTLKMATKNKNNNEMFDRTEFSTLLPTLSIKEVMQLKFRVDSNSKWESMAISDDQSKKKFLCNLCKVYQYGDKNLVQHLSGKKHFCKLESVFWCLPNETDNKNATKNSKPLQKQTNTSSVDIKDSEKPTEIVESSPTIQPNKPQAKEAASKPLTLTKPVPNKITAAKSTVLNADKTDCKQNAVATNNVSSKELVSVTKSRLPVEQKTSLAKCDNDKVKPNIELDQATRNILQKSKDSSPQSANNNSKSTKEYEHELEQNEIFESIDLDKISDVSDVCVVEEEMVENTVKNPTLKSSAQINVVVNTLSLVNPKSTKISCVPISKLIILKHSEKKRPSNDEHKNNDIDTDVVVVAASEPLTKIDICSQKEDKRYENDTIATSSSSQTEKVDNRNRSSYLPTLSGAVTQGSTFESPLNVNEILGLLGVEYVIKIGKFMKDKAARFQCSLCDITADEISMQNHLIGYNHRLKYCEKHFPTAMRHYKQYIAHIPEDMVFKVLSPILEKLAMAIEKHHGREKSYVCYDNSFVKNRQSIVSTVFHRRHASEVLGPSFTHVVDSKDVDILIANACKSNAKTANDKTTNVVSNESSALKTFNSSHINLVANQNPKAYYPNPNNQPRVVANTVDDETHKRMVDMFLRDTRQTQPMHRNWPASRTLKRSRSRSNSSERKRMRSTNQLTISQWDMERRSLSPLKDGDIWQAYRHMVDQSVRELNASFDLYKADPEKHPLYNDEWEKFWKRRRDELIAAGINHRTYNFQNEWILFFNARLEELYNQDVENIKMKCRERLCLPMTNAELSNSKYHVHISDNPSDDVSSNKTNGNDCENIAKPSEILQDVNVIHVLRLLTALEDHLGSLGPSITELLAKALQTFKLYPNKANNLLLTNENCAILETAKEKFTGLVISKILDPPQERALKMAIINTEQLLKYASKIQAEQSKARHTAELNNNFVESSNNRLNTNFSFKSADRLDNTGLAAKLASSLISQGKTKINQAQLQQIVQVYSQLEQQKLQDTTTTTNWNRIASQNARPTQGNASNNNFDSRTTMFEQPCRQTQNFNYNNNRAAFATNYNEFPNSNLISGTHNNETSTNYFTANMVRTNHGGSRNINQMGYFRNGQQQQQQQQDSQYNPYDDYVHFDSGKSTGQTHDVFRNNRNF